MIPSRILTNFRRKHGFRFGYLRGVTQQDMERVDLSDDLYLATARAVNRYYKDPEGFERMQRER